MMALPIFALLMAAEAIFTHLRGHNVYALKDFGGSMSQLGINIVMRLPKSLQHFACASSVTL